MIAAIGKDIFTFLFNPEIYLWKQFKLKHRAIRFKIFMAISPMTAGFKYVDEYNNGSNRINLVD